MMAIMITMILMLMLMTRFSTVKRMEFSGPDVPANANVGLVTIETTGTVVSAHSPSAFVFLVAPPSGEQMVLS